MFGCRAVSELTLDLMLKESFPYSGNGFERCILIRVLVSGAKELFAQGDR